jgi:hypothetical protein
LAASGGIVGIMFSFVFCGFVATSRNSLQVVLESAFFAAHRRHY